MKENYNFQRVKFNKHYVDFYCIKDNEVYYAIIMNEPFNHLMGGHSDKSDEEAIANAVRHFKSYYAYFEKDDDLVQSAYEEFLKTQELENTNKGDSNGIIQRFKFLQYFSYYKTEAEQLEYGCEYQTEYSISTGKLLVPGTIIIEFVHLHTLNPSNVIKICDDGLGNLLGPEGILKRNEDGRIGVNYQTGAINFTVGDAHKIVDGDHFELTGLESLAKW
jgi:hypothetical protein